MPENVRTWVEIVFNVSYLLVIWGLVIAMTQRRGDVAEVNRGVANRLRWAFALLALGDTGHVGFRVVAYALGGVEANPALVGLGALSTAYTVTIFYMLMVDVWRLRFQRNLGWFGWLLLAAGIIRMIVMAFPQNEWQWIVPPYGWSLLRNAFLVLQGLGVMALFFRDAARAGDRTFTTVAWMIALSFAFYMPVILWVAQIPLLGMLMIPKTCAYIAIAVLTYRSFYPRRTDAETAAA